MIRHYSKRNNRTGHIKAARIALRGRQSGDINSKEKSLQLEMTIQSVCKVARRERKQTLRAVKLRTAAIREVLVQRIAASYTIVERKNRDTSEVFHTADKTQKNSNYFAELDRANILHLRGLLTELPDYCRMYLRGIEPRTRSRTCIAYAYDLRVFFQYLMHENPLAVRYGITREIPPSLLEKLRATGPEGYMEYLRYRPTKQGEGKLSQETDIKRKLSSLRSFYKYFHQREMIKGNPTDRILPPRLHEKEIIRLDADETAELLNQIESGEKLSERQRHHHEKTKLRDLALITFLLGTGIHVSECIGLNLNDVDFRNDGIQVHRKGGREQIVYFGDEVEEALLNFMEKQEALLTEGFQEQTLFLSLQQKRLSVRSVEKLVKKYALDAAPLKYIIPYKLRSTYDTALYRKTGNIYLVADVLGHGDVNTTRKHYAVIQKDYRRSAHNKVRLREEE